MASLPHLKFYTPRLILVLAKTSDLHSLHNSLLFKLFSLLYWQICNVLVKMWKLGKEYRLITSPLLSFQMCPVFLYNCHYLTHNTNMDSVVLKPLPIKTFPFCYAINQPWWEETINSIGGRDHDWSSCPHCPDPRHPMVLTLFFN